MGGSQNGRSVEMESLLSNGHNSTANNVSNIHATPPSRHRRRTSQPDELSGFTETQGLLRENDLDEEAVWRVNDDKPSGPRWSPRRSWPGALAEVPWLQWSWWQQLPQTGSSGRPVWQERLFSTWPFLERNKRMAAVGSCVLLLLLVGLIVALASHRGNSASGQAYRYDGPPTESDTCAASNPRTYCGDMGIDKGQCEARGCCWAPAHGQNGNVPSCFHPNTAQRMGQYKVVNIRTTELGHELLLEVRQSALPELGSDIPRLIATVESYSRERLHVKIAPAPSDEDNAPSRWEVPTDLVPRPVRPTAPPEGPLYNISLPGPGDDFWVEVTRVPEPGSAQDTRPVFSTKGWGLVYKEQYMQVTTSLDPSSSLLGLGETTLSSGLILPRNGKIITLWNQDVGQFNKDINLYGAHSFYLELRQLGDNQAAAHGVFLLNSNGMDIELWKEHLTYRVIGGVFDFAIFLGPSPESVTQQYHAVIGLPMLPPRWALGYHQCRWGYTDVQTLINVVTGYQQAGLPLDVMWSDIDYMLDYRVFTLDPAHYPQEAMSKFVQWLHGQGMRWVPIQDPAVQYNTDWDVWNDGVRRRVFVRDSGGQNPYIGQVWAGPSAWPDFFNNETNAYWYENIQQFRSMVQADGLWLDMNEASNFCEGSCQLPSNFRWWFRRLTRGQTTCLLDCTVAQSPMDQPPYSINMLGRRAPLNTKTIPVSGQHSNGWLQYNTHNLYALSEAKVSYEALAAQTQQRPFLLSRASFPGLGRWAAHWTGDNYASWDNMRTSIPSVLNSNLWGMPLAGADICGFAGDTNEKLCARWLELGAFYPFSRNHAEKSSIRQEAYLWPLTRTAAGAAYRLRYRLLPTLYTFFHKVAQEGGTVARPLFFEWPSDTEAVKASDTQWLLGNSLLIAPVLWEDRDDGRNVYFPQGTWYRMAEGSTEQQTGPNHIEISAPIGLPSVYARAGYILPMVAQPAATTKQAFESPLRLLILFPPHACKASADNTTLTIPHATGELYSDDGLSLPASSASRSLQVSMTAGCSSKHGVAKGWLEFRVSGSHSVNSSSADGTQAPGSWSPSQVTISQVFVRGIPAPAKGAGTPTGPKMQAGWQLDSNRPYQTDQLSVARCTAGNSQLAWESERLKITASQPVPLLCLARIEWEVPTI